MLPIELWHSAFFFSLRCFSLHLLKELSQIYIVLKPYTEISHLCGHKKENRTEINWLKMFLNLLCSQSLILLGHFTQFLTVLFPI